MKKRLCRIAFGLLVGMTCLQGCGKPTAEGILNKAAEKLNNKSHSVKHETELKLGLDTEDLIALSEAEEMDEMTAGLMRALLGDTLNLSFDIEGTDEVEKEKSHYSAQTSSSLLGIDSTSKTEIYTVTRTDGVYTYMSTDNDEWTYTVDEKSGKMSDSYFDELKKSFVLREQDGKIVTKEINGVECFILEGAFDSENEDAVKYVKEQLTKEMGIAAAETEAEVKDIDIEIKIYVGKKEMVPVQTSIDIDELNVLYKSDDQEISISMDGTEATLIYSDWDNITVEIPEKIIEEAKEVNKENFLAETLQLGREDEMTEYEDSASSAAEEDLTQMTDDATSLVGTYDCGYVTLEGNWEREISEEDTDSNAWSYDGMTIYMSTYYGYGDETLLDNIEGQWRDALKDMSGSEPMEVNSSIGKYPTYRLISDLVDNQTGDQITFIVWCFATEDEDVHDIVLVGPSYDVKAVSKSIVATYEYGSFQFNY